MVDIFGDHIFKCTCICKIGVHNAIWDGFAYALAPVLSTAGVVPLNFTVDTEPNFYLPSDPHSHPFDLSFDPYPAPPPLTSNGCTSSSVGANITISPSPPNLPINPNSPDVLQIITANADLHLEKYGRKKLGSINKTNASTSIITQGDTLIGNLLNRNMLLIPFAIDHLGRFGPLLQNSLFGHHPAPQFWFPRSRPNATQIISQSQRHSSLGKSQLVAPFHLTILWILLSYTHSFYHHCKVSWHFINWSICPPRQIICLTKIHYFTFGDQHPTYDSD